MCLLIYSAKLVPPLRINIDEGRRKLWRSWRRLLSCLPALSTELMQLEGAKCAIETSFFYIPLL